MPNNRKHKKIRGFGRLRCTGYNVHFSEKAVQKIIDRFMRRGSVRMHRLKIGSKGEMIIELDPRPHVPDLLFINGILIHQGNVDLKSSSSIKTGVYTVDDPDRPKRKADFSKTITIPASSDQSSPFTNIR